MFNILTQALCTWFAFLLPCFATFKAISHRPQSDADLEKFAKYWTVIGLFVAFRYSVEWLVSWLPFYDEITTLFLLFLSLPQTQGSTYIYDSYLSPFFTRNEATLDADIISLQKQAFVFVQTRLTDLWNVVVGALNKNTVERGAPGQPQSASGAGLSLEGALGLFRSYAPSLINALQPTGGAASATRPAAAPNSSTSSFQSTSSSSSVEHRASPAPEPTPSFPEPQHYS